jgi:hypothetical protein
VREWNLSLACIIMMSTITVCAATQDGASYDARAKSYRAPEASLAGAADTPERMAAIAPLWQGKIDEALPKLRQLAENGDIPTELFLGKLYQTQSKLPIPADPRTALHFYTVASQNGSGEASELIAEMVEQNQISETLSNGNADFWRTKARRQGWKQQRLSAYCFDWIHGAEPLHCEKLPNPPASMKMPPEVEPQCPTEDEMASLRRQGMTGMIRQNGGALRLDAGPRARALLILDHPVSSEADLKEPDSASVVYIQNSENRWRMLPPDAPLLDRFLILTPNRPDYMERMTLSSQAVDGSLSGGACSRFTR